MNRLREPCIIVITIAILFIASIPPLSLPCETVWESSTFTAKDMYSKYFRPE